MFKYSFIIPVYNAGKKLKKGFESIINQTYDNWELICVDDGSTDDTATIIKGYSKDNEKIKYVYQENSGPGMARNTGIKICNGDYVCFMDADDYIEKDYLMSVDKKMQDNEFDVLFLDLLLEKENGKVYQNIKFEKFSQKSSDELVKLLVSNKLPWGAYNKVVKKKIIKKCEFSRLAVGEEILFTFDVIYNSKTFGSLNKAVYHYVHNENGQHKKGGDDPWKPVISVIENHLEEINIKEKYKKELTDLAAKSVIISLYRCFLLYSYNDAVKRIKEVISFYDDRYNVLGIDSKRLSKSYRIIFSLIKRNKYSLLFCICKLRSLK